MKKFTNHTAGLRGINIEDGTTVWIEPGQTVEVDEKTIKGKVPDLGKAGAAPKSAEDDDLIAAVQSENADLKKQVEAQAKQITELTTENEKLKKPA